MVEKAAILTSSVSGVSNNNENAGAHAARTGDGGLPMNRAKQAATTTHNTTVAPSYFTDLPIDRCPLQLAHLRQRGGAVQTKRSRRRPRQPSISKPPALPRVLHHPHRRARRAPAPAGTWSIALRQVSFHHRELESMSLYYHLFCRRDHRVLLSVVAKRQNWWAAFSTPVPRMAYPATPRARNRGSERAPLPLRRRRARAWGRER